MPRGLPRGSLLEKNQTSLDKPKIGWPDLLAKSVFFVYGPDSLNRSTEGASSQDTRP